MINPFADVNWHPGRVDVRRFALSLMIGFPIVATVWLVTGRVASGRWPMTVAGWLGGGGITAGVICYGLPVIGRPLYLAWYGVSCAIGLVVSNLLVAGAYYLMLTPIGVVKRLVGRPSLTRHPDSTLSTYWSPAPPPAEPSRYLRQF